LFFLGEQVAHRRGESGTQAALFPVKLDDLVGPDALVRVIDAWIGSLGLEMLGFSKTQAQPMGRPPYDPADLLELYKRRTELGSACI
jgi:hypothetical protein